MNLSTNLYSANNNIIFLSILVIIGLSIRLYFLPFETPFKTDAIDFFSFAFEVSKSHNFPVGILHTNDGWPLFLSPIFSLIGHSDMMTLFNVQRITSIFMSSLTIIPVYFLCKKFVSPKYSLIGAGLFGFNHQLIENSILGIAESLFIFLITLMLIFALDKNKKLFLLSFIFLALSSIVRYESLLLLIPLSIIFFIRFRKEKISYIKYPLFILIFILILLPTATLRMESNNVDGLTSHVLDVFTSPSTSYLTNLIDESTQAEPDPTRSETLETFTSNLFFNTFKFLGLISIPIFVVLLPGGVYRLIKTKNPNLVYLIILSIFMILPAMYAYGREFLDARYLFILFPIFCVISVYGLDLTQRLKQSKYIILIISIVILSSILLLNYDQPDYTYHNEIYQVTKDIIKNVNGVNTYPGNSFVKIATLENNWPNSLPLGNDNKITFFIKKIPSKNFTTLEDYIINSKDDGLSHIVLVEKNNSLFLDDLYHNYEKYSYLEEIYDSSNHNFKNRIVILKIDYPIFEKEMLLQNISGSPLT